MTFSFLIMSNFERRFSFFSSLPPHNNCCFFLMPKSKSTTACRYFFCWYFCESNYEWKFFSSFSSFFASFCFHNFITFFIALIQLNTRSIFTSSNPKHGREQASNEIVLDFIFKWKWGVGTKREMWSISTDNVAVFCWLDFSFHVRRYDEVTNLIVLVKPFSVGNLCFSLSS